MSSNDQNPETDLIDLNVASPVLPRSQDLNLHPLTYDTLIDSELPVLERKLQTTSNVSPLVQTQPCIDIEDILITIDDDNDHDHHSLRATSIRRSNSEEILNLPKPVLDRSWSCDNLEALGVLKNLDDVLNASLLESNKILNIDNDDDNSYCPPSIDDYAKQTMDCLLDLDNYLHSLDPATDCSRRSSLATTINTTSHGSSLQDLFSENDDDNGSLRRKLRQMEENYAIFVAGYATRGCAENVEGNSKAVNRRPLSACGRRSHALNRTEPGRATVAAIRRSGVSGEPRCSSSNRISAAAADSDDDIDWSWTQEVAAAASPTPLSSDDVTIERRAHASGDCYTGTVVVEPPLTHRPSTPDAAAAETTTQTADGSKEAGATATWLRSSMRRLRPLILPNDVAGTSPPAASPPALIEPAVLLARPVSAPSRLVVPASASGGADRASPERSRSRSRESAISRQPGGRARSSSASSRSRSVSSVASTVDSTPSCTPAATPTRNEPDEQSPNSRRTCERTRPSDMPDTESPLGQWPHSWSSIMACLGCTLGLFNISRFALLTVHFGANFIFQFFLLSLVFGLPLFTLQLCLGQQLGAGVVDMWSISPLFQGVGVSLLLANALIGLYSIIGVSWMFVFFRDSFITKTDRYRWAEPYLYYRRDLQPPINGTYKLSETIPDYFSGIVLQRHHLASGNTPGTIKFQLAFNLAVVWMIVFVSLSKGLRSYGKVIYVFTLLPVFGTSVLCAKILGMMPPEFINIIFPETTWGEFFLNPKSWLAATQEVFLTWGLLGAAVMQIASHNKHKHLLQRDSSLVAVITFTMLLLVAFLANTCVQILKSAGYNYMPNSFERMSSYVFLRPVKDPLPPSLASTPIRYMSHNSFILGEKVVRAGADHTLESGYQVLSLATELVPATFAILGPDQVSPFWAVLFYFVLILFGIAQQLAIWHCVITGIMAIKVKVLKSWETTITLFSCACGFLLGLPMATEFGIYVVYFMDYTIGNIWWLVVVILLQIIAVFMVRGRPYSGDTVVTALFTPSNHPCILSWAPALLSFIWNVILPVALMVCCITTFKNGNFREMFIWHHAPIAEYWPLWARQLGSVLQMTPILLIPLVAVIQSYRYLNSGPPDILDRIQLLYRPPIGEHMTDLSIHEVASASIGNTTATSPSTVAAAVEDPPPKYTPPPSYTTATGARLAKFLRQSIRRSVRRIANVLGETSRSQAETSGRHLQPPPPDYNAVLVEMNQTDVTITVPDLSPSRRLSTLERLRALQPTPGSPTLTAAEVASILRSSFRRSTVRSSGIASLSAENLVESAAPIGETSLVMDGDVKSGVHN